MIVPCVTNSICALTLPMLLTSSGTVVATEKSKIQEWPFAGLSRGHTVVVMHRLAALSGVVCMSCERRSKICSKTGQNPEKFSASGGGLRRRLRRAQSSLRSLKSLMSSAPGQVLDLILEPLLKQHTQKYAVPGRHSTTSARQESRAPGAGPHANGDSRGGRHASRLSHALWVCLERPPLVSCRRLRGGQGSQSPCSPPST